MAFDESRKVHRSMNQRTKSMSSLRNDKLIATEDDCELGCRAFIIIAKRKKKQIKKWPQRDIGRTIIASHSAFQDHLRRRLISIH